MTSDQSEMPADSAEERGQWLPIESAPTGLNVLVTNNLDARDAHGQMSHLWLGMVHKPRRKNDPEGYIAFRDLYNKVYNLTHWCWPPMPPQAPPADHPEDSCAPMKLITAQDSRTPMKE